MKKCCVCKKEKELSEFNKNKLRKDKHQSFCRECGKSRSKFYYKKDSNEQYSRVKLRRIKIKIWLAEYKKNLHCSNCNESDPICLDFHHNDTDKEFCISDAPNKGTSQKNILKEIQKCIVLCSNCHRKFHRDVNTIGIV